MPKRPVRPRKPPAPPSRPAAGAHSNARPGWRSDAAPQAPRTPISAVWAEGLLWLLVLVTPVLVLPAAREAFRLPKLLVAEWLALASLLPLAWQWARRASSAAAPAGSPRDLLRHPALLAVLPVLLVASAGWLTTRHPLHLREALFDLWIGAACLVGWSLGLAAARLERLLLGLLIPATVLAVIAILQTHGLWQPFEFAIREGASRLGITATAGNPGDLGAYLVLPALLGQWQLARLRSGPGRWSSWVTSGALAVILYALARTQTLAALAALGLASLVLWAGLVPRRRRPLLLAVVGIAMLLPLAYGPLRTRVVQKAGEALAGDWNAVLTGRLDGWRAAANMLAEHPLAGVGQGAYRPEFVPAKLELLERGEPFLSARLQVVFANAHNEVLEAGAEWGLPGLLALLWAIGVLLAAARRAAGPAPDRGARDPVAADRPDRRGPLIAGGLTALAVLALVHFPFRIALTAFPALLFLAWVLRRAEEAAELPAAQEARGAGPAGLGRAGRGMARAGAWAALAALALALAFQSVRLRDRLQASSLLRRAEARTLAAAATGRIASTLLQQNLLDLERAARLDPVEVGIPLARGSQFLLMRRAAAAIESYERALALEPRPEIYLNRARARLLAGEAAAAEEDFARAARLDPALRISRPTAPVAPPPLIPFADGAPPGGPGQ